MNPFTYESDFTMPPGVSREAVIDALTNSAPLSLWFAEHADVVMEEGGPFRFWGRYTYGQPDEATATQSVLHVSESSISFTWSVLDRDTAVTWSVVADGSEDSRVTVAVKHMFDALPAVNRAPELIDDLWRVHMGGLCSYLRGEDEIFRLDYANPNPVVRHSILINAPRERVFAALIQPEQIQQWFPAPAPFVDPRVGGDYGFGFSFEVDGQLIEPPPMKILEFVENERLSITWPDWRMDASVPDQTVTWILEEQGTATKLTLVHNGFTRAVDVSDYPFGWRNFLNEIRRVATN